MCVHTPVHAWAISLRDARHYDNLIVLWLAAWGPWVAGKRLTVYILWYFKNNF